MARRMRLAQVGGLLVLGALLSGCDLLNTLPTVPPSAAPGGLSASFASLEDAIQLTWSPVERATGYRVFRASAQDGPYEQFPGEVSTPSYVDPVGLANQGVLYWYKVRACNSAGCGPEAGPVPGYAGRPPAPTNVQASTTHGDRIVVTWDPVPGATYYQVHRDRSPDAGFPIVPGAEYVTGTAFEDETASAGLRYWYRVRACREVPGETKCSVLSGAAPGCRAPCLPPASDGEP